MDIMTSNRKNLYGMRPISTPPLSWLVKNPGTNRVNACMHVLYKRNAKVYF